MKTGFKPIRAFVCLIFATMLILGLTTPTENVKADTDNNLVNSSLIPNQEIVKMSTAMLAAKTFIEGKKSIFDIQEEQFNIDLISTLYNLDDFPTAYYLIVKVGNEIKGYVLISANFKLDPVLEYGSGDYYGERISSHKDKAYYFGVNKIYFGNNGEEVKKSFQDSKEKILNKLEREGKKGSDEYDNIRDYKLENMDLLPQVSPGWNALLDTNEIIEPQTVISSYKVLNVDRIWQRSSGVNSPNSACGPTTGAMIADYYHDVMNFNVYDNAQYGSWAALINHLYYEMHSAEWGTSFGGFSDGMLYHLEHKMTWTTHATTNPDFSDVTTAINSSNPIAVEWPYFVSGGATYSYHFVAGIGYDYEGAYYGDYQVAYKDPDGGENNTATHWFDWSANVNDINTVYFTN